MAWATLLRESIEMKSVKTRFARFFLALALSAGMAGVPASAEAAPPSCPRVMFLGLHGLNEGGRGAGHGRGGDTPDLDHWGVPVDSTWRWFVDHYGNNPSPAEVQGKAVPYARLNVSLWNPVEAANVLLIQARTEVAVIRLKEQIIAFRALCQTTTAIVLAGYSQGAWVVDKAVRLLGTSKDINERLALRSVVGVFLMGDPAWPHTQVGAETRAGMATWIGAGYPDKDRDYLKNELSTDEFQSICLGLSNGQIDPLCMGRQNDVLRWHDDIGVHGLYIETGVTRRGGDFLYSLAQGH
jgi:hypothetical protein